MPLDTSKLKTYLASAPPRAGRKSLPVAQPTRAAASPAKQQQAEAMRAQLERGDEIDVAAVLRLASSKVGYMELRSDAVGFCCGSCSFIGDNGECSNPAVKCAVSESRGCCNLFWPADDSEVAFPAAVEE